MNKYKEVIYIHLKSQLAWRADVAFNMLFTITKIIFAYLLWGIIFRGKDLIADFTFHGMLSYYVVSSFLSQLEMSGGISEEITGSIVPLMLFPEPVLRIMKLLPFYYITYLPSMLFIGRCEEEAVTGVVVLLLWCFIMQLVIRVTWKTYRTKYDGVGI